METPELVDLITNPKSVGGFVATLAIVLILMSSSVSKAAADYGGILGAGARWWHRRKQAAIEADEQSEARRLERLEETVHRLDREISKLRRSDQIHHEYQIYVVEYWRRHEFWAAENNIKLPPPPMLAYPRWRKEHYPDSDEK